VLSPFGMNLATPIPSAMAAIDVLTQANLKINYFFVYSVLSIAKMLLDTLLSEFKTDLV
jgi:hypothetical protein